MAFTQTDRDNVQAAIVALALGQRITRLQIDGKLIEKQEITAAELQSLLSVIDAELGEFTTRSYMRNMGRATQ